MVVALSPWAPARVEDAVVLVGDDVLPGLVLQGVDEPGPRRAASAVSPHGPRPGEGSWAASMRAKRRPLRLHVVVPTVVVPLNSRCSRRWAVPVVPRCSFEAAHPVLRRRTRPWARRGAPGPGRASRWPGSPRGRAGARPGVRSWAAAGEAERHRRQEDGRGRTSRRGRISPPGPPRAGMRDRRTRSGWKAPRARRWSRSVGRARPPGRRRGACGRRRLLRLRRFDNPGWSCPRGGWPPGAPTDARREGAPPRPGRDRWRGRSGVHSCEIERLAGVDVPDACYTSLVQEP